MTVLHATVTRRNSAPAPFHHADALIKAATPDRFAGPIWPLNENEIDLPTENRPATVGAGHARDTGPAHARDEGPAHARDTGPAHARDEGDFDAPHFLGSITARQRGIPGPLSLDVMLSADGKTVEIGPFTLDHHNLRWVQRLIGLGLAITRPVEAGHARDVGEGPGGRASFIPETGRGITGWDLAEGLAEGETRP